MLRPDHEYGAPEPGEHRNGVRCLDILLGA